VAQEKRSSSIFCNFAAQIRLTDASFFRQCVAPSNFDDSVCHITRSDVNAQGHATLLPVEEFGAGLDEITVIEVDTRDRRKLTEMAEWNFKFVAA